MKVELIAHTPNPDLLCALATKTCVSSQIPEEDVSLESLRHACSSGHESVTEHASFTFAISGVSRALTHQLVRHRIGIAISQQSQRYVNMEGFEYVTPQSIEECDVWYTLGKNTACDTLTAYRELMRKCSETYRKFVDMGIPEEDARYVLPNACTTNLVLTVNARELRHIAGLRLCVRSQWEIRELVTKMVNLAKEVAPTLFDGVGARCEQMGYCIEQKGCGKYPKKSEMRESHEIL